jgi:hypothetical protein
MAKAHVTAHQLSGYRNTFLNVVSQDELPCGVGVWGSYHGTRTVLIGLPHKGFALVQVASDAELEEFMARRTGAHIVWDSKEQP